MYNNKIHLVPEDNNLFFLLSRSTIFPTTVSPRSYFNSLRTAVSVFLSHSQQIFMFNFSTCCIQLFVCLMLLRKRQCETMGRKQNGCGDLLAQWREHFTAKARMRGRTSLLLSSPRRAALAPPVFTAERNCGRKKKVTVSAPRTTVSVLEHAMHRDVHRALYITAEPFCINKNNIIRIRNDNLNLSMWLSFWGIGKTRQLITIIYMRNFDEWSMRTESIISISYKY